MNFDQTHCRLALRDEDGFVRCQPDPYGSEGTAQNYEAFQPFGLYGRPKAPTNGIGAHLFVMRHGDDTFVLPGHDPRWVGLLPDFGDGGAPLYATVEIGGTKKAPYVAFFGESGAADEGTFRIAAYSSAGTTTIEISPSSGDVTITHPGGTTVTVKSTGVELAGTTPLVKETGSLATFFGNVVSALGALGQTVAAPTGYTCTKVNGT
jgi:hypothetical protein